MSFKFLNAQLVSESEQLFDLAKQKAQKEVNGETDANKSLVGRVFVKVVEARNLAIGDVLTSSSDPYVIIQLGSSSSTSSESKKLKTSIKKRTLDPIWNEEFTIDVYEDIHVQHMKFEVYDEDTLKKDDFLGYCIIQFGDVKFNELEDKWYPLRPRKWNEKVSGDIHIQYRYIPEKIEQQKHVNIRHLLKDKFTRTYFLQFLHLDHSEENLLFYLQVEEFKERVALEYTGKEEKHSKLMRLKKTRSMLSSESVQRGESAIPPEELNQSVFLKLYNDAKRIYTLFIRPDAEQEVNLDYEVKEFYIELFESEKGEAKRIETFRETYATREQLMAFFELPQISAYNIIETDCFPRFVKSTHYQRLLQSIEWVRRFLDFQSEQQVEALNRLSAILGPKEFGEMRKFMNKRISSDKKLKAAMGIEGGVDGKFIKSEHHEHQSSSEGEDDHSDVEEPASDDEITDPPPKLFSMTPIQPLSGSSMGSSLSLKGEESATSAAAKKKLTRKQKLQIVEGVYRPNSFRT